MNKSVKEGDSIKLEKRLHKALNAIEAISRKGSALLNEGAHLKNLADESLWKNVFDRYPELKRYHLSYCKGKKEVIVLREKEQYEP